MPSINIKNKPNKLSFKLFEVTTQLEFRSTFYRKKILCQTEE